jgi:Na+-translocating ferredoxin:NAD+ oxidoreductase subunit A
MNLLAILISSMLVSNIVLMQFLGLCSFFGVSTKMKSVVGMGAAVIVVIFLSAAITYPLYHLVLVPLNVRYIDTIAFVLVIAALVQLTELVIKRFSQSLYKALGVYLPLIATNCAVLGVALTNVASPLSYIEAITYALGSGLGYAMIIITFTAIRVRLDSQPVPKALKGMPIALITAGLMAMAFMGLVGII